MIVRTYDSLWKVDKRLYRIGEIVLDRAPLYSQIAFFGVGLILSFCILAVFGCLNWNYAAVKYAGVPLGFCMFMTVVKFDGKRPDRFVLAILRFYFMPRLICRYQKVEKPQAYTYEGTMERIISEGTTDFRENRTEETEVV